LSEHLHAGGLPLHESATVRNLAVLNDAIQGGYEPSRAFTLACLFTDLHLSLQKQPVESTSLDLLQELRTRGFPRGDTERMRLLLVALTRLMNPSQRTRGMHRRPYFVEAKALHDLVAGSYPAPPLQPGNGASANGALGNGTPGRRRRRRPSRWRKRRASDHGQSPQATPEPIVK
jgi:hypothetical protein